MNEKERFTPEDIELLLEQEGPSGLAKLINGLKEQNSTLHRDVTRIRLRRYVSGRMTGLELLEEKADLITRALCDGCAGDIAGYYGGDPGDYLVGCEAAGLYLEDEDGNHFASAEHGDMGSNPGIFFAGEEELPDYFVMPILKGKGVLVCRGREVDWEREKDFLLAYAGMVSRELTGILAHEKALREEEHEQKLLKDIGIIGILCHELMKPLTPIRGFTKIMYDEFIRIIDLLNYEEEKKLVSYYYGKVNSKTEKMIKTIKTLLHFARIESGSYQGKKELFRLNETIREIGDALLEESTEEGKQFRYFLHESADEITADPDLASVSVENIMVNALRHGEDGPVDVITETESGRVCVRLRNRGRISEIDEIFNAYKTTKAYAGGTGLGMPIVKTFTEVQGGEVLVRNVEREGTSFVEVEIFLPSG